MTPKQTNPSLVYRLLPWACLAAVLWGFPIGTGAAFSSPKVVSKWSRFEVTLTSSRTYSDPLQNCELVAEFVSPTGETNRLAGFWDGHRTWRVRFRPDLPGKWSYRTLCSDSGNKGLHDRRGEFVCTAAIPSDRFSRHGPIRVSRQRTYFQHEDGTPFFWLADLADDGPRLAQFADWTLYAEVRNRQHFTAVQWTLGLESDLFRNAVFTDASRLIPNPDYFRQLDRKIDILNRSGLLSAIQLFPRPNLDRHAREDLEALLRYVAARWNGHDVAWLISVPSVPGNDSSPWREAVQTVFASAPGPTLRIAATSAIEAHESWSDGCALAPEIAGAGGARLRSGPVVLLGSMSENSRDSSGRRIGPVELRQEMWTKILQTRAAGITYSTEGVRRWDVASVEDGIPLWHRSLFLPGAKQMRFLSDLFDSVPYWELESIPGPSPEPSDENEPPRVVATQTSNRALGIFYVWKQPMLEFSNRILPDSPVIRWLDPRTGTTSSAAAAIGPRSVKLPTPGAEDWVLILRGRTP